MRTSGPQATASGISPLFTAPRRWVISSAASGPAIVCRMSRSAVAPSGVMSSEDAVSASLQPCGMEASGSSSSSMRMRERRGLSSSSSSSASRRRCPASFFSSMISDWRERRRRRFSSNSARIGGSVSAWRSITSTLRSAASASARRRFEVPSVFRPAATTRATRLRASMGSPPNCVPSGVQ